MSSWETTALRLQGNVTADSTPSSLDKSLPLLPKRNAKARATTDVKEVSPEEKNHRTEGWKPLSLSTPMLLAMIVLTILLAVAVETLAQRSAAQGGLALSPTLNEIPGYAKFSYLYVPTIVAVLYSMIWSWIDLDVKRMQPWFELSKHGGATAENSLLLDYQYDFVALVPFKAAKQKHWPVFFGGSAMIMVLWLLTPLQSALLGTQVNLLDPEVLNNGYAVGWLGQPFPPFTTSKYALLPFYVRDSPAPDGVPTNWTAETTKLTTELSCWPADIRRNGYDSNLSYSFLNGQGCNATVNMRRGVNYTMYYIGYYSNAYADIYLGSPHCPRTQNSTHQFLATWARQSDMIGTRETIPQYRIPNFDISAIFCQPTYYKQRVRARVTSSNFQPDSEFMHAVGPKEKLTDKEFNSTAFEYLLANGVAEKIIVRDYPFIRVVEQHPRLNRTGLTKPVSNMVGYALAGRDNPVTDYASMEMLERVYNDAHQYLFSLAVNRLLTNGTDIANNTAAVDFFLTGVVVSRVFATTVEGLMVVIAIFTALVLWLCRRSPSRLPMNPSSISKYLEIFRGSHDCLNALSSLDNADEKTLFDEFRQDKLRLIYDDQTNSAKVTIEKFIGDSLRPEIRDASFQKGYYDPVKPLALRRLSGLLFVLVLTGAMVGLSYLKQQEKILKGLHRPSQNFEVLQLLENYIPTIFATLVEPFWVLLNRLLCVLQPFRDLWRGKADPSRTISASYTSIPPQLVIWRALKSKHFILVLVCAMALLGNLLAVGMGSLFNEAPIVAEYTETLMPVFNAKLDNSSVFGLSQSLSRDLITTNQYSDHYYVAMANLSSGTTLPPWVSKDYYFQRHTINTMKKANMRDTYSIPAWGFGATANCTPISTRRLSIPTTTPPIIDWSQIKEGNCGNGFDTLSQNMRENSRNRSTGVSAQESIYTIGSNAGPVPCTRSLLMEWTRTYNAEDVNGTVNASFMTCRPIFETAMFNLTVDSQGHVLSYERTSELQTTMGHEGWEHQTDYIFQNVNNNWNDLAAQWHNDSTARDWMNFFTVLVTGSRDVVNPRLPPPDTEKLKPIIEDIYRRVFAIFLSLNEQLFDTKDEIQPSTIVRRTEETRIFMENASFIITMTVLALNTVVAVLFYSRALPFVLPRLPTTLGSIMAYVAPSRLAGPDYNAIPKNTSRTFSFGRYIGRDGDVHIGIEMDPHVVPVDPLSLKFHKGFFRRVFRTSTGTEGQSVKSGTWL